MINKIPTHAVGNSRSRHKQKGHNKKKWPQAVANKMKDTKQQEKMKAHTTMQVVNIGESRITCANNSVYGSH